MNYDRVIVELLDRVAKLEDEVRKLKGETDTVTVTLNTDISKYGEKTKSYTQGVIDYLEALIKKAKEDGKEHLDVVSYDLQKAVGLKNRIPLICNAMRKVMREYEFEILADTPSQNSSTFKVRFFTKGE
jgi:hypothetical protein